MNLVPAESEVDEEGYEVLGSGDASPDRGRAAGLDFKSVGPEGVGPGGMEPADAYENFGAEEDEEIVVYENSDQTDDILVHPNPVYGERGENGSGGGVGEREEMDDIPVHPNPLHGERGNSGVIEIPAV